MIDEQEDDYGRSVNASSLAAYRSILHPPSRAPWIIGGLLGLAMVLFCVMYLGTIAANAYNAKLCHDAGGTWGRNTCEAPTVEVKQYQITIPPITPEPETDVPKAPAPVAPETGPQL